MIVKTMTIVRYLLSLVTGAVVGLIFSITLAVFLAEWIAKQTVGGSAMDGYSRASIEVGRFWNHPVIGEIYAELSGRGDITVTAPESGSVWWMSQDGYMIHLPTTDMITVTRYALSSQWDRYQPSEMLDDPVIASAFADAQAVFRMANFRRDLLTSSREPDAPGFGGYVEAWRREGSLCTMTLHVSVSVGRTYDEVGVTADVACATGFPERYAQQRPYLETLRLQGKGMGVRWVSTIGDFSGADITDGFTGYYSILKKVNGQEQEVYSGQDEPLCSDMDKWGVPKELYGRCYLADGQTLRE